MPLEVRKSFCSICSRGCGVDLYIENETLVKLEPSPGGNLCVKGYANKDYLNRKDRIKSPMRRVGPRGSGEFEEISWEAAYKEIAARLLETKKIFGADSVAFYTGFSKWYRPIFHRFVHSFGTLNYGTESSSCHQSYRMASELNGGALTRTDMANSDLFIGWAYNPFHNGNFDGIPIFDFKEKGGKVLIVDPRLTPAGKLADILLRPFPGTDGALALYFGNYLIENNLADLDYIEKYVYGFDEYKNYAARFTLTETSRITGIDPRLLLDAARLIGDSPRFSIAVSGAAIPHHVNGMQNCRAILALSAISGNFDREGGNIPVEYSDEKPNRPKVLWDEFIDETRPLSSDGSGYQNSVAWRAQNKEFNPESRVLAKPKIGSERFPLWSEIVDEFQAMDLARNILEETPYPIRAMFCLGLNRRMFINNEKLMKSLERLVFFADVDIFWTDAAKYADIVLPACASFERSELQENGPFIQYLKPALKPMYQSKSDVDIICELADYMDLDDPVLRKGYDYSVKYVLRGVGTAFDDIQNVWKKIPGKPPYIPGASIRAGLRTPTGKYELYSKTIEKFKSAGLEPLPVYADSLGDAEGAAEGYPMILTAGGRIPTEFHSRFQNVKTTKFLRPDPAADINPRDALRLGIKQGDDVSVSTPVGAIYVKPT